MQLRDQIKLIGMAMVVAIGLIGAAKITEAAPATNVQVKGPFAGISPLVRIYAGSSETPAAGINANGEPAAGSLQTSDTEIDYEWRPTETIDISRIQFYSSAPGQAYVRLYESEAGKPGKLLAESGFSSEEAGWQGQGFAASVQAVAGHTYYLSYAHERDISDYLTQSAQRQSVSFFWKDITFTAHVENVTAVEAPVLTRVKAYDKQIKLDWNESANSKELAYYEVYRNGTKIALTKMTYFVDQLVKPEPGVYTYTIRAVKSVQSQSEMSNALSVTIESDLPALPVVDGTVLLPGVPEQPVVSPPPVVVDPSVTPPPTTGGVTEPTPPPSEPESPSATPPPTTGGVTEPTPPPSEPESPSSTPPPTSGVTEPTSPPSEPVTSTPTPPPTSGVTEPTPAPSEPESSSSTPPVTSDVAESTPSAPSDAAQVDLPAMPKATRPETGEVP